MRWIFTGLAVSHFIFHGDDDDADDDNGDEEKEEDQDKRHCHNDMDIHWSRPTVRPGIYLYTKAG